MDDEAMVEEVNTLHAMNRLGQVDEIADAVCWLASDGVSFATGEALVVDGGYTSR